MEGFISVTAEPEIPNNLARLARQQAQQNTEYNRNIQQQYLLNRDMQNISTKGIHEKLQPYAQEILDRDYQDIANTRGRNSIETNLLQRQKIQKAKQKMFDLVVKSNSLNMATKYDPTKHVLTSYGKSTIQSLQNDQANFDATFLNPNGEYDIKNIPLYHSKDDILAGFKKLLPTNVAPKTPQYRTTPNGDYEAVYTYEIPQPNYEEVAKAYYKSNPALSDVFLTEQDYLGFVNPLYDTYKTLKTQTKISPNYKMKMNRDQEMAQYNSALANKNAKDIKLFGKSLDNKARPFFTAFAEGIENGETDFYTSPNPTPFNYTDPFTNKNVTQKDVLHNTMLNDQNYGIQEIIDPNTGKMIKTGRKIRDVFQSKEGKIYILVNEIKPVSVGLVKGSEKFELKELPKIIPYPGKEAFAYTLESSNKLVPANQETPTSLKLKQ